jgi:two-component system osmolarity sensor histidine kinase EnvZ
MFSAAALRRLPERLPGAWQSLRQVLEPLRQSAVAIGGSLSARPPVARVRTWLQQAWRVYWLRRVMPRGLFGRSLLIVVLPLLIAQAVLAYIFYERHWDTVTRWLAVGVVGDVGMLITMLDEAETRQQRGHALNLARRHFGFAVSLEPDGHLGETSLRMQLQQGDLERTLSEQFALQIDQPLLIDTRPTDMPQRIAVYIQLDEGLLRVLAPRKRVDSGTTTIFIGWMIGLSLLLLVLAIFFLTRQVRPIRRLAWAANNFGKGRDVGDFKLEGATEIRQAGTAFNVMRKRILRHIAQRTEMLAAVSHDLRTPLTRMRLELEMLASGRAAPEDVSGLRTDVDEMARLVDGYLAFVRGEGEETVEPTDLGTLLGEVADRARDSAAEITIELEQPIEVLLRPIAFRRCLNNLLDNATRFASAIQIRATTDEAFIWLAIDDDGPGIPEADREAAFRAFTRLDPSRNPSTGGVGLGLAIARDIVISQGGDVELLDSPLGGLRVLIRLPR